MSAQPAVKKEKQPLKFSTATKAQIKRILARYPDEQKQSAVIPVLKMAQNEFDGWLNVEAMHLVADALDMPYIRVYEVATFYTMFNLKPVGKYHVQVCTNCSCMIRGSGKVVDALKKDLAIKQGETTSDGMFTLIEVECLGACVDAPMMQINNEYYTNLTPESACEIVADLKAGKEPESDTPAKPLEEF